MSNILLISAVFPPEPVVSAILSRDLAEELAINNRVTVLCPQPSRPNGFKFEKTYNAQNFIIIRTDSYICPESKLLGRFRESYSFGKQCSKYIKKNSNTIDIIYNGSWPLFGQYIITKAAKKFNIPVIIPVQDIYPESLLAKLPTWSLLQYVVLTCLLPIDKYLLTNSVKIHTISYKMKDYIFQKRGVDKNKIEVVYNWQDEKQFIEFQEPTNKKNDLFTFMYLGNIGPLAGLDFVIEAFVKLDIKTSRLVIAGSGSMKDNLVNQSRKYALCNIEFINVPDGKVPEIQQQADVMILPIKKGFSTTSIPSKLPAYMFSQKPIISCVERDSDTGNTVLSSECGWVTEPENIDNLAECMLEAQSTDKIKLQKLGYNGFKYAIENFSKKDNLEKLCKVFESIQI